jgi:hypothetical protein
MRCLPPETFFPMVIALFAPWALADANAQRARQEEEVMQRMLMLQHRSLFGDRPLPLSSADGSRDATAEVGSCSTGTSAWTNQFAAEQAEPRTPTGQAMAFAAQFQVPMCPGHAQGAPSDMPSQHRVQVVARAFNEGTWTSAQDLLYQLCLAGQSTGQACSHPTRPRESGSPQTPPTPSGVRGPGACDRAGSGRRGGRGGRGGRG